MFSVPLHRALVVDTDLPYPEGRAAAEVLEVGSGSREGAEESTRGLMVIVWNSLASAGFAILTQTRLVAAEGRDVVPRRNRRDRIRVGCRSRWWVSVIWSASRSARRCSSGW